MQIQKILQGDQWLGHPVHPALVVLPLGMWTFSAVLDVIASATRKECPQDIANTAITGGLIGAGLAASTGIAEFLRVPNEGDAVRKAVTHGALNATATSLFAMNAVMRSNRRRQGKPVGWFPKLLSAVGVATIGYTGWLGGTLAYRYGAGVQLQRREETRPSEAIEPDMAQAEAVEQDEEIRQQM